MSEQANLPPNVLTAGAGCADDVLDRAINVLAFMGEAIPAVGEELAPPGANDGVPCILSTVRDALTYLEEQRLPWAGSKEPDSADMTRHDD
jgi:hypothetical protein